MFRQESEEIRRREIPFGGQTGQPPAALHAAVLQMDFDHVLFQEPEALPERFSADVDRVMHIPDHRQRFAQPPEEFGALRRRRVAVVSFQRQTATAPQRPIAFQVPPGGGDRRIVKSAFELKLLSLAGYMPGLDGCRLCGAPGGRAIAFDPLRGDFVCAECAAGLGLPLNSSGAALAAMRYIVSAEPKRVFSFRLPDAQLAVLSGLTEKYVEQQLERRPATLDFYDVIGRTEK